jgi:hypothetical protein
MSGIVKSVLSGGIDMIKKFLNWLIDDTKRYQLTIIYISIFFILSLLKRIEPASFGIFSAAFTSWIISETIRKAQ